jgi:hypothetical protein
MITASSDALGLDGFAFVELTDQWPHLLQRTA